MASPKAPPKRRKPKRETPKPKEVKPKPPSERVAPSEVRLERVKGTPGKGGDASGEAWDILSGDAKVGDEGQPQVAGRPQVEVVHGPVLSPRVRRGGDPGL